MFLQWKYAPIPLFVFFVTTLTVAFRALDFPILCETVDSFDFVLLSFDIPFSPNLYFDCTLFFLVLLYTHQTIGDFSNCFLSIKWKKNCLLVLSLLSFSRSVAHTRVFDFDFAFVFDVCAGDEKQFRKILCLSFPIDGLPAVICDMCRCVSSANSGNNRHVRKWYNDTLPGARHAYRRCVVSTMPSNTAPYHTADTKTISSANILKSNIDTAQRSKYNRKKNQRFCFVLFVFR